MYKLTTIQETLVVIVIFSLLWAYTPLNPKALGGTLILLAIYNVIATYIDNKKEKRKKK